MSNAQETVGDRFKTNSTCKVFGSGGDRLKLAQLSSMQEGAYKEWIETVKNEPTSNRTRIIRYLDTGQGSRQGRRSQSRVHSSNELFSSHGNYTNYFNVRGRHGNEFDFS